MTGSLRARATNRALIAYDRIRGLDFQDHVDRLELGYDPEVAYGYAPSGDRHLKAVLKQLKITSSDSIIDVGCGKGSAMRLMLHFPFRSVAGVELSERLAATAERNFERMRATRASVHQADAAQFGGYGGFNILYFFNPFAECVMERVMERVVAARAHAAEETLLVYNNPTCHDAVVGAGFSKIAEYPDEFNNGIAVYSILSVGRSRLVA